MSDMTARDAIAHCLLMGQGAYESPEDFADAVLRRLAHEGFAVVRKENCDLPDEPPVTLTNIVIASIAAHRRMAAALAEPAATQAAAEMIRPLVERYEDPKLLERLDKLQHDLDEAVGYKLAAAEWTTGDRDRDDV